MIEIEKKFLLSKEAEQRLLAGAEFLGEKMFTDRYYDTDVFDLTISDRWLRARDDRFELKIALPRISGWSGSQYDEIIDEDVIREKLNIARINDLHSDLISRGYSIFCICKTIRRKYRNQSFVIDLDKAFYPEFPDFIYSIAEIELLVTDQSEVANATARITHFATMHGLTLERIPGKIVEYLSRFKPLHYARLREIGVVRDC